MNSKQYVIQLIKQFNESVKKDKDAEELKANFKKSITESYSRFHADKRLDDEAVLVSLKMRYGEFPNYDVEEKRRHLLEDEALLKIKNMSNKVFEYAKSKANGKIVEKDFDDDKIVGKLESLLKKVQSQNIKEAEQIVTETKLDLLYLHGDNVCSLRIRPILLNLKERE